MLVNAVTASFFIARNSVGAGQAPTSDTTKFRRGSREEGRRDEYGGRVEDLNKSSPEGDHYVRLPMNIEQSPQVTRYSDR